MTSTKRWRRPRSTTVHLPARLLKTSAKENAFARVRQYVRVAGLIARIADGFSNRRPLLAARTALTITATRRLNSLSGFLSCNFKFPFSDCSCGCLDQHRTSPQHLRRLHPSIGPDDHFQLDHAPNQHPLCHFGIKGSDPADYLTLLVARSLCLAGAREQSGKQRSSSNQTACSTHGGCIFFLVLITLLTRRRRHNCLK